MSEGKRIRRTPEQIVADLDVQIEKLKDSILELENKKAESVTCLLYTSFQTARPRRAKSRPCSL